MKQVISSLLLIVLLFFGCKKETVFDENETINNQLKKYVYEYMLLSIDPKFNYA